MQLKTINLEEENKIQLKKYVYDYRYTLEKINEKAVFLNVTRDNIHARIKLRETMMKNPDHHIIIISDDKDVAALAWKVDLFNFIHTPLKRYDLKRTFYKMSKLNNGSSDIIKLTYKGGFDLLNPKNICLIQAAGNYVTIFLKDNKKKFYTYKLGEMEQMLNKYPYLIRTDKSFIINMDKISKVEKDFIKIRAQTPIKLNMSRLKIRKIRKIILWYV